MVDGRELTAGISWRPVSSRAAGSSSSASCPRASGWSQHSRRRDADVTGAVREFRLERGLLSAEDLRAWMARAGAHVRGAQGRGGARRSPAAPAGRRRRSRLRRSQRRCRPRRSAPAPCGRSASGSQIACSPRRPPASRRVEPLALERQAVQRLVFEEARTVAGGASPESGVERAGRLAWIAALDEAHREWEAGVVGTARGDAPAAREGARVVPVRARRARGSPRREQPPRRPGSSPRAAIPPRSRRWRA